MALKPLQQHRNIQASFEHAIQTDLVSGAGIPAAFPAVPFDASALARWVEVDYLGDVDRQWFRLGDTAGDPARDAVLLVQLSIFTRTSTSSSPVGGRFDLEEVRDVLSRLYHKGKQIPVYDYAGDDSLQGYLTVTGWDETAWYGGNSSGSKTSGAVTQADMRAWSITLELRYTAILGS